MSTTARILVVEDDAMIRAAVVTALQDEGYDVLEAADGLEALDLLAEPLPALLLLDLWLPNLDGPGLARALRESGLKVPILVMTASRGVVQHSAAVDAAGWISKPFELEELLAAVARLADPAGR